MTSYKLTPSGFVEIDEWEWLDQARYCEALTQFMSDEEGLFIRKMATFPHGKIPNADQRSRIAKIYERLTRTDVNKSFKQKLRD